MTDCALWYRRPAQRWVEALPVGNGRLGAMVFGGVGAERWQLNEDSLWTGGPEDAELETAAGESYDLGAQLCGGAAER